MTQSIICIMGPTASGKSKLAMQLAKTINCQGLHEKMRCEAKASEKAQFIEINEHFERAFNKADCFSCKPCGEIISVDSALVYRDMNIGTAKPTAEELAEIPHHLINIRDPKKSYSTAEFCVDARAAIKKVLAKNKQPILVGGTMLYFKALQFGLNEMPSANKKVREKISQEAKKLGWPAMHKKLQQIDPKAAKKINPNDSQRIQRALEVYELTGQPISDLQTKNKNPNEFNFINFAIKIKSREELHKKIAKRFKKMLEQGLIEEVRKLFNRGDLNPNLPSMRAVGYRQVWQYLAGEYDYETMIEKAIAATRQLAKRQLTWLKSWPDLHWIDQNDLDALKKIRHYL